MRIFTYHLALLAEALFEMLESDDRRHRGWRFSLYRALRTRINGDTSPIYWKTNYSQWSVDHHFRSSKNSASSRLLGCTIESIDQIDHDHHLIKVLFTDLMGNNMSTECILGRHDFPPSLWHVQNVFGDTLLDSVFERDCIFDGLISERPDVPQGADIRQIPLADENHVDVHPKLKSIHALTEAIRPWYAQANEEEQSYLDTVLGAAVFYLPHSVAHFNGFISLACLQGCLEEKRKVKDHIFPRKRTGRRLLTAPITVEELQNLYHNELAQFMYLTPSENARMVNYYETYDDHDAALVALGIIKFPAVGQNPFYSHSELGNFLKYLVRIGVELENMETARRALDDFRLED